MASTDRHELLHDRDGSIDTAEHTDPNLPEATQSLPALDGDPRDLPPLDGPPDAHRNPGAGVIPGVDGGAYRPREDLAGRAESGGSPLEYDGDERTFEGDGDHPLEEQ